MGQESGRAFSGWFCLRICREVIGSCQPGLQSTEALTGAGGPTSKVGHSHGSGQEASVPCHMDLSIGRLECPLACHLASPRAGDLGESKAEAMISLMT